MTNIVVFSPYIVTCPLRVQPEVEQLSVIHFLYRKLIVLILRILRVLVVWNKKYKVKNKIFLQKFCSKFIINLVTLKNYRPVSALTITFVNLRLRDSEIRSFTHFKKICILRFRKVILRDQVKVSEQHYF